MDEEVILYVASIYKNSPFPMQNINRALGTLHAKNITTLEGAVKELSAPEKAKKDKDITVRGKYR
jgi:hypothetical protein